MSLKKVTQLRADRGFKIWDLAVYAVLAVIIAVLFAVFVFSRPSSSLTSISISYGFGSQRRTVCTYSFATDSLNIADSAYITLSSQTAEGITLTFSSGGGEYNTIYINKVQASVSVTEANCPALDCVHTAAITSNSSLPIICSTHSLIISSNSVSGSVIQ